MKYKLFFIILFLLTSLNTSSAAGWWDGSWESMSTVTLNTTTPDNDFQVHLSSDDFSIPLEMWMKMNHDGNDTRILHSDNTTVFPIWIEHLTARDNYSIWVNVTDNTTDTTLLWYYRNPSASSVSDGDDTFIQWHGTATATFHDSNIVPYTNIVYEAKVKSVDSAHNLLFGLASINLISTEHALKISSLNPEGQNLRYAYAADLSGSTNVNEAGSFVVDQWYKIKSTCNGTNVKGYVDGNQIGTTITTNLPDGDMGLAMYEATGNGEQEWSFARKYNINEPIITDIDLTVFSNVPPTIPTLITPSHNSIKTSSPITYRVSSTDTDGDDITYYYYADTSPGSMSFIGTNDSLGSSSFNWSVYQYGEYYWTARAYDGYEYSDYMDTKQFIAIIPPLATINLLNNSGFENWSAGPSSAPDNWSLSGLSVEREHYTVKNGSYSVKGTYVAGGGLLFQSIPFDNDYRSQSVTSGMWILSSTPNICGLRISDGVDTSYSPSHTGGGNWEWITLTHTLSHSATQLTVYTRVLSTGVGYFDDAVLVAGIGAEIAPYPENGSTIYTTYPPLTYDISFTWQDVAAPQYKLMVAEDENFNVLAVNTHVGTDNSVQSLLVNKQYWWKVYSYDGTTYSESSSVYNFNLTGNSTLIGSAIEGVVYQSNGDVSAISGAEVTIWNTTWSNSMITGSNGYYVFEDLNSGTVYNLQAKSDRYWDSSIALVSAESDPVTNNFYLIDDLTDTEWWHYVEFKVQNVWGIIYPNVATNVYIGDSPTISESGNTESDGTISFHLNQNVQYHITFINSTLGINEDVTLYPVATSYTVYIDSYSFDLPDVVTDDIQAYIVSSRTDATHGYINFTWSDTSILTTSINYYIHDVDGNELYSTNNSGPDMFNSQIVAATDDRYIVRYVGVHPTHGIIDKTETVVFHGGRRVDFGWDSDWQYAVTAIAFLIFIGSMFGAKTAHYGAITVVMFSFIFKWIGWLDETNTSTLLVILAAVIAFGWTLRKSEEVKM